MENNVTLGAKVEGLMLVMCNCQHCPDAIAAIRKLGEVVRFLQTRPKNPDRPHPHPEGVRIERDGSIIVGIQMTHPKLGRDIKLLSLGWEIGVATLTYSVANRSVTIFQTNSPDSETLEEMASGLVNVAVEIGPVIGANYSWVDVSSEKVRSCRGRSFDEIRSWYFANLFGPRVLDSAPDGFFDKCPCERRVELCDGSLLMLSAPSFADWYFSPPSRLRRYLTKNSRNISIFRN